MSAGPASGGSEPDGPASGGPRRGPARALVPDPALSAGPAPDPNRWRALAVCISALGITLLDVSTVNVALPSIRADTGASTAAVQWVVSGYILAFGMVPIIAGRLGDDYGRRTLVLIGIVGFTVSSAAVGLAPNPSVLVIARLVQGLCGGLINPQIVGLIQQLFRGRERGIAFGVLGGAVGVASAAGPVVGGLIIGLGGPHLGWRLSFLLNLPIGVTAFLLCRRWLPRPAARAVRRPLDLRGAALLTGALFAVLFPLVQYDSAHDPRLAFSFIPAAILGAAFIAWERGPGRRTGYPLINLGLFRIRSYADGLVLAICYFCGYAGLPLVLSLFLQEGLGYSPQLAGVTAGAFALGSAVAAPIAGRLLHRWGAQVLVMALVIFIVGITSLALIATIAAGGHPDARFGWLLIGPLFLAGLGGGAVITPNQALSLAEVDVGGGSTAGGTLQTSQRVGAALGTAITSAVFYAVIAAGDGPQSVDTARYTHAFGIALWVCVVFAVAAFVVATRAVRRRRPAQVRPG